jgi:hypothetical protein
MDAVVTQRQFIEAWQTSLTVADVAKKLRMSKTQCRVRACRYRQRGVPLKEYPPVELPVVDWEELAVYAAGLLEAPDEGAQDSSGARAPAPEAELVASPLQPTL